MRRVSATLSPVQSGLVITGDTRSAAIVPLAGSAKSALVVARCDGPVLLFTNTK